MQNSSIKINEASATHSGLVRETNEDAFWADSTIRLWIVADGMGGHRAGEVASAIVIKEIPSSIQNGKNLSEAISVAHLAIRDAAARGEGGWNMGSTVVAARLEGLHYQIAWVGDSRAYLWNGVELLRLTKDHSYVQLLLDKGLISEEEVYLHPSRNLIAQGLGVGGVDGITIKVDQVEGELSIGDTLFLCSDGLTGEIRDDAIAGIMVDVKDNHERLQRLINSALDAGGSDNITVILVSPQQA
ncbi:MAG: serine/threonine-protein phosphatase [Candidatus Methylumidiphilus alinenensis]|uniref:Serine/threonine-protein phosphatase n=1 Tax=Candidatus Methylumidiphilus alinenensis TaxID=2202197 RepID=A0A2W4RXD5_9GAMM|nr:MAG: serine/threonine-protein phosphatase [Candidatus Methylumidiphilus alinenensis]